MSPQNPWKKTARSPDLSISRTTAPGQSAETWDLRPKTTAWQA